MDLFLIRHPQPQGGEGRCYGRTDLPLAVSAEAAAQRLRPLLPAAAPLYSSPLRRCLELAQALDEGARAEPRLQELHFGRWEDRAWEDIHRAEPEALNRWAEDVLDGAPHGGETARELQARALAWVAEMQATGAEAVVAVTHGGVLKALLGHWLEMPASAWFRLHFDFAAVSRIALGPQGPRILSLNR